MALSVLLVIGCAGKQTRIDGHQYILVDDPGGPKNISLVLASYRACEKNDESCKDKLPGIIKLQEQLESCLDRGLNRTSPQVTLIKQKDWAEYSDLEDLVTRLAAGEAVNFSQMSADESTPELHYLVSIGVTKSSSDKQFNVEGGGGSDGPPVWVFGQEWTNTAFIETRVYSADTGGLAGELTSSLTKDTFWMLPVITVVPLIPIGWSPNVETTTCTEMGEALGRFFSGAGNNFVE